MYKLTGRIGDSNSTYSGYYGSVIRRFEEKTRANIETNIERGEQVKMCDSNYTVSSSSYHTRLLLLTLWAPHNTYPMIALTKTK